jgi:hypothetical protein
MSHQEPVPGTDVSRPGHSSRLSAGLIITLVVLGWIALLDSTAQPLLASIQVAALGLGALVTAVIVALWRKS